MSSCEVKLNLRLQAVKYMSMYKGLKNKSRLVTLLVVVALLAGGWLAFGREKLNSPQSTDQPSGQAQVDSSSQPGATSNLPYVETKEFKYQKPDGWTLMSQKALDAAEASSGIGRPISPAGTFIIKVSDSSFKDTNELKNATLEGLKKLTYFQLALSEEIKVDAQSGHKFIYSFSDRSGANKLTQQMSAVINKDKVYLLLFSSTTADYDKQTGDFNKILVSFKFK